MTPGLGLGLGLTPGRGPGLGLTPGRGPGLGLTPGRGPGLGLTGRGPGLGLTAGLAGEEGAEEGEGVEDPGGASAAGLRIWMTWATSAMMALSLRTATADATLAFLGAGAGAEDDDDGPLLGTGAGGACFPGRWAGFLGLGGEAPPGEGRRAGMGFGCTIFACIITRFSPDCVATRLSGRGGGGLSSFPPSGASPVVPAAPAAPAGSTFPPSSRPSLLPSLPPLAPGPSSSFPSSAPAATMRAAVKAEMGLLDSSSSSGLSPVFLRMLGPRTMAKLVGVILLTSEC